MRKLLDSRLILFLGIAVLIAVKAYFILAQTSAMGMPRIGDDSFVHIWRAVQVDHVGVLGTLEGEMDRGSRAVRDIAALCDEAAAAPPPSPNLPRCTRVADNTVVPDVKAGASLLLNLILKSGLPLKWSYAAYETLTATAVAAGFAVFLFRLFGAAPAGIALILMAFVTFHQPPGLTLFVPSTLATGLSMGLIGLVAGRETWPPYVLGAVGFALLTLVHPVALMYAGVLVMMGLFTLARHRDSKSLAIIVIAAAAGGAAIIAGSGTVRGVLADALSTDLLANAAENLAALPAWIADFTINNWAFVAAFLVSLLWFRRLATRTVVTVGAAFLLPLAASLLYKMEFFTFEIPLDLFTRIMIGVVVLACGFLGKFLAEVAWAAPAWRKAGVALLVPVLAAPSALTMRDIFYGNINGRPEVVDEDHLAAVIGDLEREATIAYAELDITPNAALIAGADRLGAIPMPGLGPDHLKRVLEARRPGIVALPSYRGLNTLAVEQARSLERRRLGLPASVVDMFAVALRGEDIQTIHLKVENEGEGPATIGPIFYLTAGGGQHRLPAVTVAPGAREWLAVPIGFVAPGRTVILEVPPSALWIRGISVNAPPRDGVNWPWDGEAIVQWHVRGTPRDRLTGLVFSLPRLFRHWGAPLPPELPLAEAQPVLSDSSGFVFIRTGYPPAR